jgi:hypothetical protein
MTPKLYPPSPVLGVLAQEPLPPAVLGRFIVLVALRAGFFAPNPLPKAVSLPDPPPLDSGLPSSPCLEFVEDRQCWSVVPGIGRGLASAVNDVAACTTCADPQTDCNERAKKLASACLDAHPTSTDAAAVATWAQ